MRKVLSIAICSLIVSTSSVQANSTPITRTNTIQTVNNTTPCRGQRGNKFIQTVQDRVYSNIPACPRNGNTIRLNRTVRRQHTIRYFRNGSRL